MCKSDSNDPSPAGPTAAAPTETATPHARDNNGKAPKTAFYWSDEDEPHASRRKEILAKYPQIKELFGYDPNMRYVTTFAVLLQIALAYWVRDQSVGVFLAVAYIIGGTSNHMLMLAFHELSHNLGFRKPAHNRMFAIFANLPVAVPAAISFKKYHLDHHKYQGEEVIDVDIPTVMEATYINSTFTKFLFVCTQLLFYALRPLFVNPKPPGLWELGNVIVCIVFDVAVVYFWGFKSLLYFLVSSLLGAGLHPVAGHFIAEHYVFTPGAETYSYYGPLNWVTFNVGYHNEHHDFPYIPGSRLPQVRQIAAEFYDPLPHHYSWIKVLYDFITDPSVTAYSRVKRNRLTPQELDELTKKSQ